MKDFEIHCDESHLEMNNTLYGKFTLGPFLPGQGTTFGNALRRSLLSELSGLAITAFEVLGVMQEFSTLPGLRESVLELSLNLKQVVFTGILPYSIPPIGFLKIKGPAVIKAMDLKLPAGVYCTYPDQYIATLSSNGTLNLKFLVSVGRGYSVQPYSLYRSLSKIRLQPILSFNLEKTNIHNDYFRFLEQGNSLPLEGIAYSDKTSTRSGFNDIKEMENKTFRNSEHGSIPSSASERGLPYPTEPLLRKEEAELHSYGSKPKHPKDTVSPTQKELGVEKTLVALQHKTESSDFHKVSKAENTLPNQISEAYRKLLQLQSTNSEFVNQSVEINTSFKNENTNVFTNTHKTSSTTSKFNTPFTNVNNGGTGYVDIQTQIFQRVNPHQVLPIDAVFTPVSRVNFLTQVNDRFETARENVVLEIWTNGSIHPKRALEEATLFLVQNFDTLLKKIQQASSFYKGLRYWNYLQSVRNKETVNNTNVSPNREDRSSLRYTGIADEGRVATRPSAFCLRSSPPVPTEEAEESFPSHQKEPSFASEGLPFPKEGKPLLRKETQNQNETSKVNETKQNNMESTRFPKELQNRLEGGLQNAAQRFTILKKEDGIKSPEKHLHQAISNLDIGNLNLSLQTFIALKEAKIHTLSQLLTAFSAENNKIALNPKSFRNREIESSLFFQEKIVDELRNVIRQFSC